MTWRDPQAAQTGYLRRCRQREKRIGSGSTHHAVRRKSSTTERAQRAKRIPGLCVLRLSGARVSAGCSTDCVDENESAGSAPERDELDEELAADHVPAIKPTVIAIAQTVTSVRKLDGCLSLG